MSVFVLAQEVISPCPDHKTIVNKYKLNNFMSLLLYPSCFLSIHLANCSLLLLLISGTVCDLLVLVMFTMRCLMLLPH